MAGTEHPTLVVALQAARPAGRDLAARCARARVLDRIGRDAKAEVQSDRYSVLHTLGSGGVGVVFAAYDPHLDRRVAIKVVRQDNLSVDLVDARRRLLAEARMMAKLSHRNIVPVHDVGIDNKELFVVMELVDGLDVRRWLGAKQRSWREVVRVFLEAGRGLQCIHEAGLIHRDFKPPNVLIGFDGSVRVSDFGLARARSAPLTANAVVSEHSDPVTTPPGFVVGTPAYMAPEINDGQPATARSDQYSFCVALHEGVFGHRPNAEVSTTMNREVPRWLAAAIRRGLSTRPDQRWPSMAGLLAILDLERRTKRRRNLGLVAAGVLFAGTLPLLANSTPPPEEACESLPNATALFDARARRSAAAFAAVSPTAGPPSWAAVREKLRPFSEELATREQGACRAMLVSELPPASDALGTRACLEERRDELVALLDVFTDADATVVHNAGSAATELIEGSQCDAAALLGRPPPPAEDESRAVRRATIALAHITGLLAAGKYDAAALELEPIVMEVGTLDHRATVARALRLRAQIRERQGRFADARRDQREALVDAQRARDDRLVVELSLDLARSSAKYFGEVEAARAWGRNASAAAGRLEGDPLLRAAVLCQQGSIDTLSGRGKTARDLIGNCLQTRLRHLGPDSPLAARAYEHLAGLEDMEGNWSASYDARRRALDILELAFGVDNPEIGMALNNLAVTLLNLDRHEEAELLLHRAANVWRELAPRHVSHAMVLFNLGEVKFARDDLKAAAAFVEDAIARSEDDARVNLYRMLLADIFSLEGDPQGALRLLETVRDDLGGRDADQWHKIAAVRHDLGRWHRRHGDPAESLRAHRSGLQLTRERAGRDSPSARKSLLAVATAMIDDGQVSEARWRLEGLASGYDPKTETTVSRSEVGLQLGRALLAGGEPSKAVEVLRGALDVAREGTGEQRRSRARTQLALAQALAASGGDTSVIIDLTKAAAKVFKLHPAYHQKSLRSARRLRVELAQ